MAVTLYGISNCDTVKRARAWLHERGEDPRFRGATFHDFKKAGLSAQLLDAWVGELGWELLLNRKGTTWRNLQDEVRDAVTDEASAKRLMLSQTSIIKRPVVDWGDGSVTVGFDPASWGARR